MATDMSNQLNAVRRSWREPSNHHPLSRSDSPLKKTAKKSPQQLLFFPNKLSTFENPTVRLINQALQLQQTPNIWKFYKTWIYQLYRLYPQKKPTVARFISFTSQNILRYPSSPSSSLRSRTVHGAVVVVIHLVQQLFDLKRKPRRTCWTNWEPWKSGNTCGCWRKVMG